MATVPTILSEPIQVADLPLPPDVAREVEEILRSHPYSRRERRIIKEDLIVRHHYAGHHVIVTTGPRGLQIHAIDLETPEEVREAYQRLRDQGHRNVMSLYPTPWKSDVSIVNLHQLS
jgi:hypothetical protein